MSHRADPEAREIADRHYNRQKPGTPQFVPPGRCLVLKAITASGRALWVTSWPFAEYVQHAWAGAWVCSAFRNEGAALSSDLIRQAVAATRAFFGAPPPEGFVSFVDWRKVRSSNPGCCYQKAGWCFAGRTIKQGLWAYHLSTHLIPPPTQPIGFTGPHRDAR